MSLKGDTNAEKIWNFLKSKGLNDYGCAGMLGNMYAESGLNPINLQNNGNKKLGMTDEEFTIAVDNGTYTKDTFIHDGFGYGLVQHTYHTRKKALYEYVKGCGKSIGDLETQLLFIYKELTESYKSLVTTLETATSVLEASNAVLLKYERPAEQGQEVQLKRASYGQTYYDKYAIKIQTSTTSDLTYKEEDVVDFIGTIHYSSANALSGSVCKAGVARVSKTLKGSKHPYHLIRTSGGGSTVYGWVDEANIKGIHKEGTTEETNEQTGGTNMGFTNSSLVSYTRISPNRTSPRNHAIDCITIHCVVGQCSVESLGSVFAPTSRQASSNYGVGYDGKIGMYCEEKDRSWCSSNAANDHRAITIEVASDTKEPYAVTDKAYNALIELVADICKRNGIKKLVWSTNKNDRVNHLNGCNMTVHRDYANKSCPGTYLYDRHGDIAAKVNAKLGATTVQPPVVTPPPVTTTSEVKAGTKLTLDNVSLYGSSTAKQAAAKRSGTYYAWSAEVVNNRIRITNNTSNVGKAGQVTGWIDYADAKKAAGIQETVTPPVVTQPQQPTSYKVGDIVKFTGNKHYTSANATSGFDCKPGTAKVTSVYAKGTHAYHLIAEKNGGSTVYGWVNASDIAGLANTSTPVTTFTAYKVKVTADVLNIRKGAGTNYAVVGAIKDKGVYTIVDEKAGQGATKWGFLKSGAGWISLDYTKKI